MFNLFDISLKLSGFPIEKAKIEFEKILKIHEDDYAEYIEEKKREIVEFHLKNNSYYKELNKGVEFNSWEELPILTKKDLQKPLKERLSEGYNEKSVFVNKTSGSSGDPFIFAKDKEAHALTWASIIHRFGWYGINFNSSYQARFYGIPLDFFGNTKERIKDLLSRRYRFSIFDLSDKVFEKIFMKFQEKKFLYINGYTSSIVLFAKFLASKKIILKNICPTLQCCVVTSEMLFEEDKKLMQEQFGIPIINEYGASELDIIAFQNPKGEWVINTETIFVEVVDDNNRPLPFGQEGKIIISSLYNKAHPFIRYEIGDIGVIDESSTPKKQILKKLIGRTNDIAILPSGKKSPGLTFYYVTKSIIEDNGNIKEFVVKQIKSNTFEIEYISQTELTVQQIKKIEKEMLLYLESGLNIIFTRKDKLERSKSGKLKQFQSLLKNEK